MVNKSAQTAPAPRRLELLDTDMGAGAHDPYALSELGVEGVDVLDLFPAGFVPDTARKADLVLGAIAERRARAQRIRDHAARLAEQAEAGADYLEKTFRPALQEFTEGALMGSRRSSLTLYHGVLGFRHFKSRTAVCDPRAALSWARAHCPSAVTETLNVTALEEVLKQSRQEVPFAVYTPSGRAFFLK